MRVLIIKLTSMGDLMHALPALTDAAKAMPEIEFDWVVDQAFADVPLWHPNVRHVIKTAHRQWKKQPVKALFDGRLKAFYHELNADQYDVIVDLQGNMKSAVVSWLRKGDIHGLAKAYCREKPACYAYRYHYAVTIRQHSIEKMRQIMAQVLDYPMPETPADYGVDLTQYALPELKFDLSKRYLFFVHNASWQTKLWPVSHWQQLVEIATEEGYSVLLPCGNDEEYKQAQQIAGDNKAAYALPKLPLNQIAALMSRADGAVCSDTGLAHMAGVAGIPAVTIYGATDAGLIGTYGQGQQYIESDYACSPCYKRQCYRLEAHDGMPVCMENITTTAVWDRLAGRLPAQ